MTTSLSFSVPTADRVYRAGKLRFRVAQAQDAPMLHEMLSENPMSSWIRLRFERKPDYFAADNLMGSTVTMIAEDQSSHNQPVGMYSCTWMSLFVDGLTRQIPYLGSLRVNPRYRNRISILKQGFRSLSVLLNTKETPGFFTSIASENSNARRLLEANIKGMPRYHPMGEMCTVAIPSVRGNEIRLLQPATAADVAELALFYNNHAVRYQFAPVLTEDWLLSLDGSNGLHLRDFFIHREGGMIKGCMAIWDQRALKQTVVDGYRFPTNILRPVYNVASTLMARARLPADGEALQQIYLSFVAIPENAGINPISLLRDGVAQVRKRGGELAVVGLSVSNPLLDAILDSFPCHLYRSQIESVRLEGYPGKEFGSIPPQPEVALL